MELSEQILAQSGVTSAIRLFLDGLGEQGQIVTVVQVGACNGNIDNDHVQELIKGRANVRAHLVEAVEWLYRDLLEVMEPYQSTIRCYNLAISDRDEIRAFYWASQQLTLDEPDRHSWQRYQLGSFDRGNLSPYMPGRYISHQDMQCVSPSTFLHQAGVDPADLDLLVVDVEGYDSEVVCGFLEISEPKLIVYEHKILSKQTADELLLYLEAKGYAHKKMGDDILATQVI